jgi:hypothetical protein
MSMEHALINTPDMGRMVRSANPLEELAHSLNFFYDLNVPI